ncbi:MAG: DUF4157 domain-containing protein [Paludibacteraceae bacterium]|nr:DUF4157 domain-containing protein [Paludibacteraceae bacterium]
MKAKIDQAKNSHRNLSIKSKKGVGMPSQSSTVVQAQLETTTPGDAYEQEADRMADMVMRKIDGAKTSEATPSSHCPTPTISCFGGTSIPISSQMESQLQSMQGGGHAMPDGLRAQMENSFGHDFSNVRLHTDSAAADMSRSINAKAFTHGNDIYFNQGQFQPNTPAGQHLIAHELTHTVQQGGKVAREGEDGSIKDVVTDIDSITDGVLHYSNTQNRMEFLNNSTRLKNSIIDYITLKIINILNPKLETINKIWKISDSLSDKIMKTYFQQSDKIPYYNAGKIRTIAKIADSVLTPIAIIGNISNIIKHIKEYRGKEKAAYITTDALNLGANFASWSIWSIAKQIHDNQKNKRENVTTKTKPVISKARKSTKIRNLIGKIKKPIINLVNKFKGPIINNIAKFGGTKFISALSNPYIAAIAAGWTIGTSIGDLMNFLGYQKIQNKKTDYIMKHYGNYDDSYKAKIAAGTAVIPLVGELFVASDNFVRSVKRKFDDIAESAARQANDFFFNMFDFFNYF